MLKWEEKSPQTWPPTGLVICFHLCTPSSVPAGFWKRQDRPQQQFQSLWQIHPGELPREWHCERVRTQKSNSSIQRNTQNLNASVFSRAYVEKYLLEKSRLVYQEHNERWEKQILFLEKCTDPVVELCRLTYRCTNHRLDSGFIPSVTSVTSELVWFCPLLVHRVTVALSGPDTNVLDPAATVWGGLSSSWGGSQWASSVPHLLLKWIADSRAIKSSACACAHVRVCVSHGGLAPAAAAQVWPLTFLLQHNSSTNWDQY